MKHASRPSSARAPRLCASLALIFTLGAFISAQAQTTSPSPDAFVAQITSATNLNSFVHGISGNGRFVVIESTANLAPADPLQPTTVEPNNADGNHEIFLFDYAQRRIYQITNTKSARKDTTKPALPSAGSRDFSNIDVDVANLRPYISYDGKWIVFQSNAYSSGGDNPGSFNGDSFKDALKSDGNQEIFLYSVPATPAADLTSGAEVPATSLAGGTFTRITNTTASRPPIAGATNVTPDSADDNRFPVVNDDGSIVAFVSSRNITSINRGANANADGNAEIFAYNRTTGQLSQLTKTANPATSGINLVYNANPSLSADGLTVGFISTAPPDQLSVSPAEAVADQGNAEVYLATFDGADVTGIKQVTRTPKDATGSTVNVFASGRRVSRNGRYVLFETRADLSSSGAVNGALNSFLATYLYDNSANTFTLVGPRPSTAFGATAFGDVERFPTFTGDNSTILFASVLNFTASGAAPASATDGLNPPAGSVPRTQIFATPVSAPTTFTRLTNIPAATFTAATAPFPSETVRRMAFTYNTELGGGNTEPAANLDLNEAFYQFTPPATSEATGGVSFFTGESNRPVVSASPAPTPGGEAVTGLAPGMIGIARATDITFSTTNRTVASSNADERARRPPLPIELNGVSVAVGNAAAGLYFVSANQLNFVVPVGLVASTTAYPVVITIRENDNSYRIIRTTLQLNAAQPDLSTTTHAAGGRAFAFNATNHCAMETPEPATGFPIQSSRPTGNDCAAATTENVATEILFILTGVRNVTASQVTVNIKGAKEATITGADIVSVGPSRTIGFDQLTVRLPAGLAGSGDSTVVVSVTIGGQTFTSRPVDTAPLIKIQ